VCFVTKIKEKRGKKFGQSAKSREDACYGMRQRQIKAFVKVRKVFHLWSQIKILERAKCKPT